MATLLAVPAPGEAVVVTVFAAGPDGGNPAPIVVDARGMTDQAMRLLAASTGHECGFVIPVPEGVDADLDLRFWVPEHEMSMCGHATIGAVWLRNRLGILSSDRLVVHTASGLVDARIEPANRVSISQPVGRTIPLDPDDIGAVLAALRLSTKDAGQGRVSNAVTSRVKTLIPLRDVGVLDAITPDAEAVAAVCERIGSTGLYPYAVLDHGRQLFAARQFPKSSGYLEDPATGIAAAALAYGLLDERQVEPTRSVRIRQGWAMGRPSEITVDFAVDRRGTVVGCRVGGPVRLASEPLETVGR